MVGRPTDYRPEFARIARNHLLLNNKATDVELAKLLGVSGRSLARWKVEHAEFRQAIREGKEEADGAVVNALYRRATGAKVIEQKLDKDGQVHDLERELPPETAAASLWLRNRQPEHWRDRVEHLNLDVSLDLNDYARELKRRYGDELAAQLLTQQGYGHVIEGEAEDLTED